MCYVGITDKCVTFIQCDVDWCICQRVQMGQGFFYVVQVYSFFGQWIDVVDCFELIGFDDQISKELDMCLVVSQENDIWMLFGLFCQNFLYVSCDDVVVVFFDLVGDYDGVDFCQCGLEGFDHSFNYWIRCGIVVLVVVVFVFF